MAIERFTIYMDAELGREIKEYCKREGMNYTDFFRQAAQMMLEDEDSQ